MKLNRNEKCVCGSGIKYKKCCLLNPEKNAEILRAISITKNNEEIQEIISKSIDIYRLKVELVSRGGLNIGNEVSRTFEIEDRETLYGFHLKIQEAFDWDNDHMFSFYMTENLYEQENEYSADPRGEHEVSLFSFAAPSKPAAEAQLRDINLSAESSFWYLFDYGDELIHKITVEGIREKTSCDINLPKTVNSVGEAPDQY